MQNVTEIGLSAAELWPKTIFKMAAVRIWSRDCYRVPNLHYVYQISSKSDDVSVTFGRLAVSDSELGVDVIDFDECYCYLFTVLYCSLVLHVGPF